MKYKKWLVFALTAILVIVSQFFVQQRYTGLLQVGAEYQWPVTLSRSAGWIPSDYLTVNFLGARTAWVGARPPVVNQEIYVVVEPKPNGILRIVKASPDKPETGDYILARVTKFENNAVEFAVPFNRVQLDLSKVDPAFYTKYKGILLASVKLKNGRGVVTGVYSRGVSIEAAKPLSTAEQEKDSLVPLQQIGEAPAASVSVTTAAPNESAGGITGATGNLTGGVTQNQVAPKSAYGI